MDLLRIASVEGYTDQELNEIITAAQRARNAAPEGSTEQHLYRLLVQRARDEVDTRLCRSLGLS